MGKPVIIYARVSTKSQNIKSQIAECKKKAISMGFTEKQIEIIQDDGVSSRKLSTYERSGLSQLIFKIRNNEVTHLLVKDRDRIARNMVEYLTIITDITQYNVNLTFCGVGVTPFTNDFGMEAYLAWYAESEGNKINERSQSARKYYPNKLYGYIRKGHGTSTHYAKGSDKDIDTIIDLFNEFKNIDSPDEYKAMKKVWKGTLNRDITSILSNPFYAGCILTDNELEPVTHIDDPIVEKEDILNNIAKFKLWGIFKDTESTDKNLFLEELGIKVFCDVCDKELSQKKYNSKFFYRCNHGNSKNKNKISISQEKVLNSVFHTLKDISISLELSDLQQICKRKLPSALTQINHEINKMENQIQDLNNQIMASIDNHKTLVKYLDKLEDLQSTYDIYKETKDEIKSWILDIKKFTTFCIYSNVENYIENNIAEAVQFFIHSIRLSRESIDVLHYFDQSYKEVN
jgi:site-specific DNA recombinase